MREKERWIERQRERDTEREREERETETETETERGNNEKKKRGRQSCRMHIDLKYVTANALEMRDER